MKTKILFSLIGLALLFGGCTEETKNNISRSIQNWTGTNGVLEVYAGDKLVQRFMKIEKISTAMGTNDNDPRPYRFGYGYHDLNLDGKIEPNEEKKIYFEFSDYSTSYVFFESTN